MDLLKIFFVKIITHRQPFYDSMDFIRDVSIMN